MAPGSAPQDRDVPAPTTAADEVAGVVHDVRQMLSVITGRSGLLLRRGPGPGWEEALRAMALAAHDASAMLDRLTAGATAPATGAASLAEVAAQAALLAAPPDGVGWSGASPWRLDLDLAADHIAAVPAQVLREVLANLLLNALAAMPGGGRVALSATTGPSAGRLRLQVADAGPGIALALRERIFRRGISGSGEPGRGQGLANCRELLRRHGADLAVGEGPGTGAVFELDLPAGAPRPAAVPAAAGEAPLPAGIPVLVVDDEIAVREMLQEVVSALGGRVTACRGAEEALAAFAPGRFAVALLDAGLPGVGGAELARRLRRQDPAVALVLISGWGGRLPPAGSADGPVDLTAAKPLDIDVVRDLLERGARLAAARRRD